MNENSSNVCGKDYCSSPFLSTPLHEEEMRNEAVLGESTEGRLATIYVPWQVPGKMFSICEGLEKGTIYKDLYRPYNDRGCCQSMDRDRMLYEIMALDFALIDLNLYLDTHPTDADAIDLFNNVAKKRKVMVDSYQAMYGPLTASGYTNSEDMWDWIEEPWPWDKKVCK